MKHLLFTFMLLASSFSYMNAATNIPLASSMPKDEHSIENPIGRSIQRTPRIGIEGYSLQRMQAATQEVYQVELLQNGNSVFSAIWNFQQTELALPNDLSGDFEIRLSNSTETFVGYFNID